MKDEDKKLLVKYTKAKRAARTNWQAFCVFNFNKLKPKLVEAIQTLTDDPNNAINEIQGVIPKWQVREYKTGGIKFNTDETSPCALFRTAYKYLVCEYAAEIRGIYGNDKESYSNVEDYEELTVWGEPVLKETEPEQEAEEEKPKE
jgi:hypothetical protein